MITLKKKMMTIPIGPKTTPMIVVEDKIEVVPISSIRIWEKNPRKNIGAIPKLAEVIKIRGQVTPVVVWRKNMTVYKGNTTVGALKLLGYKTVRVLFVDFPSDAAAVSYGIADNKSSEWAEWDEEILQKFFTSPEIVQASGFTEVEKRSLFFEPEPQNIEKINAANIGLKDKIVVIVLDVAKKDLFKDMLSKWIDSIGFDGIEIK